MKKYLLIVFALLIVGCREKIIEPEKEKFTFQKGTFEIDKNQKFVYCTDNNRELWIKLKGIGQSNIKVFEVNVSDISTGEALYKNNTHITIRPYGEYEITFKVYFAYDSFAKLELTKCIKTTGVNQ